MRLANPDVTTVTLFYPVRSKAADNLYLRYGGGCSAERYACYRRFLDRSGSDCIALTVAVLYRTRPRGSEAIIVLPRHRRTLGPKDAGEIDIGWARGQLLILYTWSDQVLKEPTGDDIPVE